MAGLTNGARSRRTHGQEKHVESEAEIMIAGTEEARQE